MMASPPSSLVRQGRYRGRRGAIHVAARWIATGPWLLVLALTGGGCSLAYRLDTTLGKRDGADQTDSQRSVPPNATAEMPSESDLAMARAAVSEVLSKGASSVPWENPRTGTRGTVTPLASLYSQNGIPCRDFLASFVKSGSESWLQGAACRAKRGTWELRDLRPWSNS
jgi:surface antigen